MGGAGYRQLSTIQHRRNRHFDRVLAMYTKPHSGSLRMWLGRGRPLNPYLVGLIIDYLRGVMKAKDLKLIPDELFEVGPMKDFLEWSTLRAWMKESLVE